MFCISTSFRVLRPPESWLKQVWWKSLQTSFWDDYKTSWYKPRSVSFLLILEVFGDFSSENNKKHMKNIIYFSDFVIGCMFRPAFAFWVIVYSNQLLGGLPTSTWVLVIHWYILSQHKELRPGPFSIHCNYFASRFFTLFFLSTLLLCETTISINWTYMRKSGYNK